MSENKTAKTTAEHLKEVDEHLVKALFGLQDALHNAKCVEGLVILKLIDAAAALKIEARSLLAAVEGDQQ